MSTPAARVEAAMAAAPRADFLPSPARPFAGLDEPLVLTGGQTCSQPSTVRAMLLLLEVSVGDRVLDVGSGSGWTTALLAALVGPTGRVDGVELRADLARWGGANVAAAGWRRARVHRAIDVLGWPEQAPYDRILVSADAPRVPGGLVAQLREGGRLVLPVRGTMTVVERRGGRAVVVAKTGRYVFVPLVTGE
ncbi:protein-L-isoaspartate O-methyltransferase [Pseudactinotalea sp. HY160]|uniref:protein-L-isoaspartate O-methyltransferase family protein n=1 Tax=Pseudactinotalea sp. HY160 TaxID=2654490 RepID=UPI00351B9D33